MFNWDPHLVTAPRTNLLRDKIKNAEEGEEELE